MRALKFITGHVIYEPACSYKLIPTENHHSEIPYFLIPHKEDHDTTKLCFEKMDAEVTLVNSSPIYTTIKGKNVEIRSKIKITQCDCKVVKEALGLNGAFCKHCFVTR